MIGQENSLKLFDKTMNLPLYFTEEASAHQGGSTSSKKDHTQ